jgi:hypothetical protein
MCTTAKFNSTFCAPTEAMQERSLKLAQKSKCEVGFPSAAVQRDKGWTAVDPLRTL